MNEPRIIKKYPNRRLYDTAISSYITLDDVRRLVIEQIPIKVIDARSQDDITHSTLLQIILEQEENGPSLFTIDSLQRMIRSYGGAMQTFLSKMFEQGMEVFTQQQSLFKSNLTENSSSDDVKDPVRLMTDAAQRNLAHWQQLQQQWLNNFGNTQSRDAASVSEAMNEEGRASAGVKDTE